MAADAHPAVVAFDGSEASEAAIRKAVELFGDRGLVVVSVWEPGLAYAMAPSYDPSGMGGYPLPSTEEVALLDEVQHDRATATAEAGARLARELGAAAEPHAEADRRRISDTISAVADERSACAIVVGSRGRGAIKS